MALLEVRGLSKYFGGLAAISDLDLAIDEGEIRGLIGPNGAGKTTLFNVISGVYRPTKGSVIYQGEDISRLSPSRIAAKGLVRTFQRTALFHDFTVRKNVINIFGAIAGTARQMERENEKKALEIVEFLELGPLKDELALNLPHGHQRALGVAIALATEPKVLMLDEPLTGMNPVEKEHMIALIRKLHDSGITILMVEHDMKSVMGLCIQISVLDFGKLLAEGPPEEILANPDVIEAYLGGEEVAA
jgi:branched-chain amino acid transport system ATP-binding protein